MFAASVPDVASTAVNKGVEVEINLPASLKQKSVMLSMASYSPARDVTFIGSGILRFRFTLTAELLLVAVSVPNSAITSSWMQPTSMVAIITKVIVILSNLFISLMFLCLLIFFFTWFYIADATDVIALTIFFVKTRYFIGHPIFFNINICIYITTCNTEIILPC